MRNLLLIIPLLLVLVPVQAQDQETFTFPQGPTITFPANWTTSYDDPNLFMFDQGTIVGVLLFTAQDIADEGIQPGDIDSVLEATFSPFDSGLQFDPTGVQRIVQNDRDIALYEYTDTDEGVSFQSQMLAYQLNEEFYVFGLIFPLSFEGDIPDVQTGQQIIASVRADGSPLSGSVARPGDATAETLVYGGSVSDALTTSTPTQTYTFDGAEGDVVVLTAERGEGDLSPGLRLVTPSGETLIDWDRVVAVEAGAILPETGTYEVTVFGANDSVGAYTLDLISPPVLASDEKVQGTISPDEEQYFVIRGRNYVINYLNEGTEYFPSVNVYVPRIEGTTVFGPGSLQTLASLEGSAVQAGTLTIGVADTPVTLLVIEPNNFEFYINPVETTYSLSVTINQP